MKADHDFYKKNLLGLVELELLKPEDMHSFKKNCKIDAL